MIGRKNNCADMTIFLEGFTPYKKEDAEKYDKFRWWPGIASGDIIDKAADIYPDKEAFVDRKSRLTYSQARDKVNGLAFKLNMLFRAHS